MEALPLKQIGYTKIVQSGDMLEVYDYENPPSEKRFVPSRSRRKKRRQKRSKRNFVRARDNFRRMVRANLSGTPPYLCTLTMVSIEEIKTAYKYFSKFTTNLRRTYRNNIIKWVAVPEFQKRGAVHFHALIWGIPHEDYLRERDTRNLQALWMRGWLDILASDGSPKIASYMAKYMSKGMYDDRLAGEKSYTASRGNMRPMLFNTGTQLAYIEEEYTAIRGEETKELTMEYERVYNTKWLGRCHYRKLVKSNIKK